LEKIGISITIIWLSLFSLLLILKWEQASLLSLNEWGDFLAGVTAPLAFLWLIVGYMLQRKELKANTEALLFQREEMANQAKELAEQNTHMKIYADATVAQANIAESNHTTEKIKATLGIS